MCTERINPQVVNVVDRYLSVQMVRALNEDAGWRAQHRMGQLIDYAGDLPEFQGGGNSNGAMIHQLSMMFKEPDDPRTKWACKAMGILSDKSRRNHDVLTAYVFLRNRPDPLLEGSDRHSMERLAGVVGVSRSAFHKNLCAAEAFILELIELRQLSSDFLGAA